MGLLLFALYACSHYGASSPILHPREDQISTWQPEPTGRGTWGLLSSCMITMGISVWSAVHLNVPGRPPQRKWERLSFSKWWDLSFEGKWERWRYWSHQLRRTRWTITGLLAPELVVYCAWVQWSNARELSKRVQDAQYSRSHPWTLSHSFFAGMGGFAVYSSEFIPGQDLLYLTTAGAHQIVKQGYQLPDLHEEAIKDKSKADALGKILVCLQAGYMIFQVIGRLAAHLPITLLEVNTLGHVLCALTMYAFWFHKPLGVSDPIILSEDVAKPLMASWFIINGERRHTWDYAGKRPFLERYRELDIFTVFAYPKLQGEVDDQTSASCRAPSQRTVQAIPPLELLSATEKSDDEAASHISKNPTDLHGERNTPVHDPPIIQQALPENFDGLVNNRILFYKCPNSSSVLSDEEIMHRLQASKLWNGLTHVYHCGDQDEFERWWERWSIWEAPVTRTIHASGELSFIPRHVFLDSVGLRRWELANRGLELYQNGPMLIPDILSQDKFLVTRRMNNWPSEETGLLSHSDLPFWIMICVTALYGALHALCWHSQFPSLAEKMLWRTASIIIAAGPVTFMTVTSGILYVSDWLPPGRHGMIWALLVVIVWGLCGVIYVGARLFILLEAFISLRDLPAAAYQTPNWTPWLPHL